MEIRVKFDTRKVNKHLHSVQKAIPRATKVVIDSIVIDMYKNYRERTAGATDIVGKGNSIRPYTKSASRYKRARINELISHYYINKRSTKSSGVSQYEYLKNTIDKGMVRTRTPKRQNLLVPSKSYNRRKRYGQADKRGGIDVRPKDFWLPNRHGNFTLFERRGGKLNPLWHTTKRYTYTKPTLPFYEDAFKLFQKKQKYYTGKFFNREIQKRVGKKS